ncbi:MAG: hypothetical protein M1833_001137 [Piccolia ochrophora]|nr:MAG: hypothetical protein M1833_001137 [Piccolia ochrophora]
MKYAYYIVMGGFRVDLSYDDEKATPHKLTSRGAILLAHKGIFFQFTDDLIEDQSKSDPFAKTFVCIQVVWMVVQVVSRKAVGYPITLLELHTFVHVVFALAIYALWFHKPQGLREPTYIESSIVQPLADELRAAAKRLEDRKIGFLDVFKLYHTKPKFTNHFVGSRDVVCGKLLVMLLVCTFFGGFHLAAWNFTFPTEIERRMWQDTPLSGTPKSGG